MDKKLLIQDIYPLSPIQQGILFHTLSEPESGFYFVQSCCTLSGEINIEAFKRAWQRVVDHHTVLRTAFIWKRGDEPLQAVHKRAVLPIEEIDWSQMNAEERRRRLEQYLKEDRARGFILTQAPLMRIGLIKVSETEHEFIWSFHHLLMDGWSTNLMMKEAFTQYEGYSKGEEVEVRQSRPYGDYIEWLSKQDMGKAERYWRGVLKGFSSPTSIGVEMEHNHASYQQPHLVKRVTTHLSAEVTGRLKTLAKEHRLTMNTLVQGAWALLLSKYSGQPDVVFGVTTSGRPVTLQGCETMIGLFINTLPVRMRIEAGREAMEWLRQIQVEQVELREYEYSPLVQVQGWSDVPRGTPLFDTILVFENYPEDETFRQESLLDGTLNIIEGYTIEKSNYGLAAAATVGDHLHLGIKYDARRFETETLNRMLRHWQRLLESMLSNPQQRLGEMSLLTDEEWQTIVVEWNQTKRDYPADKCIHQLFEAQVERTPKATAVVYEGERLTYQQLNERANQLAHRLRSLGVSSETIVGICMQRSMEMVVAILGVLKAGGAYVPLDPAYPAERLAFMLEDTQASVLLTQPFLTEQLGWHRGPVVSLSRDWQDMAAYNKQNPLGVVLPENLAYVMYTSGSTGRPKGVMIAHRGVCNHVIGWLQANFPLTEGDRIPQKNLFSFDVSVREYFWPLLTGACIVMLKPNGHLDSSYMTKMIVRHRLSNIYFVSSTLQIFLDEDEIDGCDSLKYVLCGAESLSAELQERYFSRLKARLYHFYGPTENTITATFRQCYRDDIRRIAPIGKPISNTQVYILDHLLQPLPVGVVGRIYVSGAGLARGYLNRPDLTADKFIPDPFSASRGARMYSTGDLGRFQPDGEIQFLGRIDDQLKIRGFRIEPAEIESALLENEAIAQALVMARQDASLDRRLVAYIVPRNDRHVVIEQVRESLTERLPGYMQPSAFVVIDRLPLNANGKVDRKALPPPAELSRRDEREEVRQPRNQYELQLLNIFEQILGGGPVSVDDNFFELGGHSILALRVLSRIHKQMACELELSALMKEPTIGGLARLIREQQEQEEEERQSARRAKSSLVAIQPGGSREPFYCVHPIGGQVMCYVGLARRLGAEQPLYGLEAGGLDEAAGKQESIEGMAAEYVEEVKKAHKGGPYLLGGWSMGGVIAYEMARQMSRDGEEVGAVVLMDTMSPAVMSKLGRYEEEEGFVMALFARSQQRARGIDGEEIRPEEFKGMSEGEQLMYLKGEGVVPEDVSAEFAARFIEGYRRRQRAIREYRGGGYEGRVVLVRASRGIEEGEWLGEEYKRRGVDVRARALGWEEEVSGEVEVYEMEAEHERMMEEPYVGELAKLLLSCFDKSLSMTSA